MDKELPLTTNERRWSDEGIERGNPPAAAELRPLVYGELWRLAKQRLAREQPGQNLQAMALVHEA